MTIKEIKIGSCGATLTAYIADEKRRVRDAMLVIPGGGYAEVCDDREGEPIALAFLARGMNAFVLKYIVPPKDKYQPLYEASLAVQHIKENAEAYCINASRVFAVGFSAGGHLCATLGTMWLDDELNSRRGIKPGENKLCGMVLCYPLISSDERFTHVGCFDKLLGEERNDESLKKAFSLEKRVNKNTCPAFIVHTAEDAVVPIKNSLAMASALAENGVMFELHVYPKGPHGMALATENTECGNPAWVDSQYARWVDDVIVWSKRIK